MKRSNTKDGNKSGDVPAGGVYCICNKEMFEVFKKAMVVAAVGACLLMTAPSAFADDNGNGGVNHGINIATAGTASFEDVKA